MDTRGTFRVGPPRQAAGRDLFNHFWRLSLRAGCLAVEILRLPLPDPLVRGDFYDLHGGEFSALELKVEKSLT